MTISERLRNTTNALKAIAEKKDINRKNIIDSADDVYNDAAKTFFSDWALPALWLDENGFGLHSFEECDINDLIKVVSLLNEKYGSKNEPYVTPLSYTLSEETEEYDFSELCDALDQLFCEAYEEALAEVEASFIELEEEKLIDALREAYNTMYCFEWTGWHVAILFDEEENEFTVGSPESQVIYHGFDVAHIETWNLSSFDFDEEDEDDLKSEKINDYIVNHDIEAVKDRIKEGLEREELKKRIVWID